MVFKLRYSIVDTEFGWVIFAGSEKGLRFSTLPQQSLQVALAGVSDYIKGATEDSTSFDDLPQRFQRYFEGELVTFPDKLDLEGATHFLQAVWSAARSIPYGEVRSYAWVARRIGKPRAYRAVGLAMARNPFPVIIPCHRVVASDGSLGGFSAGLGYKQRLLALEAGRRSEPSLSSLRR